MDTKFENGKMIITHASGHIDIYAIEDLEKIRDGIQKIKSIMDDNLTAVQTDIVNLNNSIKL